MLPVMGMVMGGLFAVHRLLLLLRQFAVERDTKKLKFLLSDEHM